MNILDIQRLQQNNRRLRTVKLLEIKKEIRNLIQNLEITKSSKIQDIEKYFSLEVEPHLHNSWIDFDKSKEGYEINFTKYFYKYKPLRSSEDITRDLLELDKESENLLNQIMD